ncbi:MAG: glycerol-3-phosphate acyltransferase [Anaerolineaceae bacterium]|nr:glycerol-3-phosphate acyltransferase [Anaerolineaceae bacterium]
MNQNQQLMLQVIFILIAFLCGSLPFSIWLGKILMGLDVRHFGDGNPGSANVFRAGNKMAALLVLILDISKAAIPVGLAYHNLGMRGPPMYFIAIAPILGHVFSPFLGFRGGKGLATALGVWIGLTIWKASLAGVISVAIGIALFSSPGWAVMLALAGILSCLLLWMPDPLLLWVLVSQTLILIWTHRFDLSHAPRLRPWLAGHFLRGKA